MLFEESVFIFQFLNDKQNIIVNYPLPKIPILIEIYARMIRPTVIYHHCHEQKKIGS